MNNTFYSPNDYRLYLEHHGIKGMKWGVRRFQNSDGSYTSAGKSRYGVGDGKPYKGVRSAKGNFYRASSGIYNLHAKAYSKLGNKKMAAISRRTSEYAAKKAKAADDAKAAKKANKKPLTPEERAARNAKLRKAALAIGGAAALAGGAYAYSRYRSGRPIVEGMGTHSSKGLKRLADPRMTNFKQRAGQYARSARYKAQDIGRGVSGGAANARNAARRAAQNAGQFANDYSMRFRNRDHRFAGTSPKVSGRADAIKRAAVNGANRVRGAANEARNAARNTARNAGQFANDYSMRFRNRDHRLAGTTPKVSGRADALKRAAVNAADRARTSARNAGQFANDYSMRFRNRDHRFAGTSPKVSGRADAIKRAAVNAADRARSTVNNYRNRPIVEGRGTNSSKGRSRFADPAREALKQRAAQYARSARYKAQDVGRGVAGGAANARNAARRAVSGRYKRRRAR